MKEEILNTFVAEMTKLLQSGSEFVVEQMPIVCQEVLQFRLVTGLIGTAIGLGLIMGGIILARKTKQMCKNIEDSEDREILTTTSYIVSGLACLIGNVPFLINGTTVLKVLIAPRLYLLEYFANLV